MLPRISDCCRYNGMYYQLLREGEYFSPFIPEQSPSERTEEKKISTRFDQVVKIWNACCGGHNPDGENLETHYHLNYFPNEMMHHQSQNGRPHEWKSEFSKISRVFFSFLHETFVSDWNSYRNSSESTGVKQCVDSCRTKPLTSEFCSMGLKSCWFSTQNLFHPVDKQNFACI